MIAIALSPRQTRTAEITSHCLLILIMGVGLLFQLKGWELDGSALIAVGGLVFCYVTLFRSQLAHLSARIEELEKKLSTNTSLPNV